jgi:polar amino acid transport system substrate-binding protein
MSGPSWTRRDFFRRSAMTGAIAGGVALGGPVLLSACSQVPPAGSSTGGTLDRVKQAGTIKVGIANEAPYGFTDSSGTVTGESVEVGRAVLKNLGIANLEATTVDFGSLIPALTANQFDMVTAGMFINASRCANAAFSTPDYTAPTAFLVPAGNPDQIATFADVTTKNLQLGVLSGAVEQGYAQQSGVPDSQIQVFDAQNTLLQAVTSKRVNAAALTNISLNDVVAKNPGSNVEVTKGFFPTINGQQTVSAGAFVFRQADTDFVTAFDTELTKLHQSGQWLQIAQPFGFSQDNVPGADVTTEKLCAA